MVISHGHVYSCCTFIFTFPPHASPFSLSSLPSCPHLIHLMAVCLTLASSTEQINRSWKRPSVNLLMISSFYWTHKCLPLGCLSPFRVIILHVSIKLLYLEKCIAVFSMFHFFCFVSVFWLNNSTATCQFYTFPVRNHELSISARSALSEKIFFYLFWKFTSSAGRVQNIRWKPTNF